MKRKFVLIGLLLCCFRLAPGATQLLTNGGFESGVPTPWVFAGTGQYIRADIRFAFSGIHSLSMGNVPFANQTVSQSFYIPTNTSVAVLNYYWAMLMTPHPGIDQLKVWIAGTNALNTNTPIILVNVDTRSNTSTEGVYLQKTFDLTPFIGQTISVYFAETSDPTNGAFTTFYIDDVSVLAGTSDDLPPNDSFENSALLSGAPVSVSTSNTFASKEPGEPFHGNNSGGRSLWWKWTAPTGGTVSLNTSGSYFNTLLGVYVGSSVTNLSLVASTNGLFQSTGTAQLKFKAAPGVEYQIAVDGYGGNIGRMSLTLSFTPDTQGPSVSFTSPASGAKVTNATIVVQGKASDSFGIASVEYRLENAAGTNAYQLASGTNNWTATVANLIPGLNTVRVRAFDPSTNVSPAVARSFNYVIMSPLTLTTNGNGTVTPNLNGQLLEVGSSHTVTAKPGVGHLFAGWSGDAVSAAAKLTFIMQSNMVLQANFITNPFIAIAGNYEGLFYDTNGVAVPSAGFFSTRLKSTGAFSARARAAGRTYSFSGQFNTNGASSNYIALTGVNPLTVQLQLDLAGDILTGRISDGVFTAELLANRAVYSRTLPAPTAGKYTLLIPGADDSQAEPGGDSFGTVTVDATGRVNFRGTLADGTKVTQRTFVSREGFWAFFGSLYRGSGLALGWLSFTNTGVTDVDGLVSWIKLPQTNAVFYPGGFTNEADVVGSSYVFSNGVPVLNVSTGLLTLINGNLPANITNQVFLGINNRISGTTNLVNLSISTASGSFKGSVPNPVPGGRAIIAGGVVLQKQNYAGGFFAGTNQTGRVRFEP